MNTRPLPPPIRPRALTAAPGIGGYTTTDGRYELRPHRYGTPGRVRMWSALDLRGQFPGGAAAQIFRTLDDFRAGYCAPGGAVPWLVADPDHGVMRVEPTRRDAAAWGERHCCAQVRTYFHAPGSSIYEYLFADPGDDPQALYVLRADHAHLHGWDPVQQPLYPYPDAPHEEADRPAPAPQGGSA